MLPATEICVSDACLQLVGGVGSGLRLGAVEELLVLGNELLFARHAVMRSGLADSAFGLGEVK